MAETPPLSPWQAAKLAAALVRESQKAFGGIHVRGSHGPALEAVLSMFDAHAIVTIPHHVDIERLTGGLDLAATLAAGKPVPSVGLLQARAGSVFLLTGCERITPQVAACLAAAVDDNRICLIAVDESLDDEAGLAPVLAERLAFQVDLRAVSLEDLTDLALPAVALANIQTPHEQLLNACIGFGVVSLRTGLFAHRAASMLAAGHGRSEANAEDLERAAQLVIAHRARSLPATPDDQQQQNEDTSPDVPHTDDFQPQDVSQADVVTEAVRAALPPALLQQLHDGMLMAQRRKTGTTQLAGRKRSQRGRPAGVQHGDPRRGNRLNLVATLTAAAPWQSLRKVDVTDARVRVLKPDFRITRFKPRTETVIIFTVDASGSAAFQRLSEAKGAVELILADCYIHRDKVALIAFRGTAAEVLLPPTRSLERAKRALAALPGGGGTPLVLGIEAAALQAQLVLRAGSTPVVIFLTDGKANVARDGTGGRARAHQEAIVAAKGLRALGLRTVMLDIAPKPSEIAGDVARHMGASYLTLPSAGAASIAKLARSA
jgi:magnesium chelatase subunit D